MTPDMDPFDTAEDAEAEILAGNEEEVHVDSHVSKCPTCGANLVYSPEKRKLECPFCGNAVDVDLTEYAEEIPFANILGGAADWGETRVFTCANCGARTIISDKEIAPVCPSCGTPGVIDESDITGLRPNAVLPFLIDKPTAAERFKAWVKRKFFAPGKYKKSARPEQIAGNYFPAFTFDSDTFTSYRGRLGKYYYVTVRRNGKTYRQQRVRYFDIGGTYSLFFNDVLVYANESRDEKHLAALLPFATDQAQKYNEDFIYGFGAAQYDKDGTVCWGEAQEKMRGAIRRAILSQYTYDVVASLDMNVSYGKVTYKYMLLPVYIGHSKYRDKLYNFFVNGQSGKVAGKTPVSPVKVTLVALLGAAVLAGLGVLIYFLTS